MLSKNLVSSCTWYNHCSCYIYYKYRYYKSTAINISIFRAIPVYIAHKSENIETEIQMSVNYFSYLCNIYRGNKTCFLSNKLISKIKLTANLHLNNTKIAVLWLCSYDLTYHQQKHATRCFSQVNMTKCMNHVLQK